MNSVFQIVARVLIFIGLISVDIVLGVICSSYYASVVFNTKLSVYYFITLTSMVWVVYTADHIIDGSQTKSNPDSVIYHFHYNNRFVLLTIGLVITLLSVYLVLYHFEERLIKFGIGTFVLVVVYLILNFVSQYKNVFFPKELIISVLYTWGIFGGPLSQIGKMELFQFLIIMNFLLLVFCNVLLFSFFDSEKNRIELKIITSGVGQENARKLIVIILLIAFIFSLVLGLALSKWSEVFILILINITLLVIILFPSAFRNNKNFGLIADSVFIYPLLIHWFC